jgi:phenylalanyl-tRNA synthetase alpha chain
MEANNPPLRIIVPGRCFRHEATDASHDIQFYQVEGLMVDKKISAANFRAVIEEFFKHFFEEKVAIRLRPSYFPFTEPSFEVDLACLYCMKSKGRCSVCKGSRWLEMMGAGMVHPNVFKRVGYNPKNWQGFAFGMGLDRLVMMKYEIPDIRLLYKGDLRVLKQF